MIQSIIDAHNKYIGLPFYVRNTARFYSLATELFGRLVTNQPVIFSSHLMANRIDQKIAKLMTYIYGSYLCYDDMKMLQKDGIRYETQQAAALTIGRLSNSVYFLYDACLLLKFFTAKPLLTPLQESIRGIAGVITAVSFYRYCIYHYESNKKEQTYARMILNNICLITLGAEGLLLIARSTIKNEVPMLQNCLLITGIANIFFNYLYHFSKS